MMKFLFNAIFCGSGAFFPFLLIDNSKEADSDEV